MSDKKIGPMDEGRSSGFVAALRRLWEFFFGAARPAPAAPVIDSFRPIRGCPGIMLEIHGRNFGSAREDNDVTVGGATAYVVEASAARLKVITSYLTKSGPLEVTVGGCLAAGPVEFEALGWPRANKGQDGPPILYTGAGQDRTGDMPSTGRQRVLIVLCHPRDLTPPDPDAARDAAISTFDAVRTYYDQVGYGALDLEPHVTSGWCILDGDFDELTVTVGEDEDNLAFSTGTDLPPQAARFAAIEAGQYDPARPEVEQTYLTDFALIVCMVYTDRATDGRFLYSDALEDSEHLQYNNPTAGINIDIVHPTGDWSLILVHEAASWATWAHEIGHCMVNNPLPAEGVWRLAAVLGEDLYQGWTIGTATAEQFDMMGLHERAALFSGYYMEQLGYYDAANIHTIVRSDHADFSGEFLVVAHGETQNSTAGRYHLIKIQIARGLHYYVEVRQRPDPGAPTPRVFDANIPLDGATHQGGVVVTKVFTDTVNMNQQMRFITLLHPLTNPRVLRAGESAIDPARNLKITVLDDHVEERPLVCRVQVEWTEVGGGVAGDVSLWIQPWNEHYATPDIWIDRAPLGEFDCDDPALGLDPDGNKDRPRVDEANFFYGCVHCNGPAGLEATDVRLTFYVVTPPGVGDNGNWAPLMTRGLPRLATGDAGERAADWVPEIGEHTCLKLYASGVGPTGETLECWAQENVFEFLEAVEGSLPGPVTFPVAVRNPRDERVAARISLHNVPEGFVAHFPHAWVWLEPWQERRFTLTVILTRDYGNYQELKIPWANVKVKGWIPHYYHQETTPGVYPPAHVLPMGGILTRVIPKRKVELSLWELEDVSGPDKAALKGKLVPIMRDEKVVVELEDPAGRRRVKRVATDSVGCFTAIFDLTQKPSLEADPKPEEEKPLPGIYVAQAFVVNSPHAAQAESNVVYLEK